MGVDEDLALVGVDGVWQRPGVGSGIGDVFINGQERRAVVVQAHDIEVSCDAVAYPVDLMGAFGGPDLAALWFGDNYDFCIFVGADINLLADDSGLTVDVEGIWASYVVGQTRFNTGRVGFEVQVSEVVVASDSPSIAAIVGIAYEAGVLVDIIVGIACTEGDVPVAGVIVLDTGEYY